MSSALVRQIIIEAKGNTAHVEAAIAQLRGELKGLKSETTSAGAAGSTLGNRYGSAAIGISSAAENMARLGKVTGESAKMMINQSAQVAFAFGPHGMLIGAIGITTLAIVEMFGRAKKEAKAAADAIKKDIAEAMSSGSLTTMAKAIYEQQQRVEEARKKTAAEVERNRRARGEYDPNAGGLTAPTLRTDAAADLARQEAQLKSMTASFVEQAESIRKVIKAEEALKDAKKDTTAAERDAAEARQAALSGATAQIEILTNATTGRWSKEAEAIEARDKREKESAETSAELMEWLAREAAKRTKTLVDDINLDFEGKLKKAVGTGDWDLVYKLEQARAEAVALQEVLEELDAMIADADDWLGKSKKVTDTKNAEQAKFNAIADAIERAARGGIQLAEAIGLVSANASKSLQAIAQIAVSLPQLRAASQAGQWSGASGVIASALPVVGGIATMVDGFLSAGKAAREHAKALREAAQRFTESLQERVSGYGLTDAEQRARDIAKDQRDALSTLLENLIQNTGIRIGTREDFFKADPAGQRKILTSALASEKAKFPAGFESSLMRALEAAIEQFDLIAEAAKNAAAELEAEHEAKRKSFDQSLEERRLRLAGDDAAADAIALLTQHEQELAAARKEGIYTAEQLTELQRIQAAEEKKAAEAAQKRREEEEKATAQVAARRTEDLQSRINAADGESPAEAARRREIENRREIEDAMAEGADAATIALIQLAQAAEGAAAAQAALTAAQRDMEDLDVRLLRAQGKGAEADQADFANRQKRELEDAQAAGKDAAFLAKLRETQAAELKKFLQEIADAASGAAGGGGADLNVLAGADTVVGSVGQAFSEGSANRVVSELSSIRIHTKQTADGIALLRAMSGAVSGALMPPAISGGGPVGNRLSVTVNNYGPINAADGGKAFTAAMVREMNRQLGQLLRQTSDLNGSAAIT